MWQQIYTGARTRQLGSLYKQWHFHSIYIFIVCKLFHLVAYPEASFYHPACPLKFLEIFIERNNENAN